MSVRLLSAGAVAILAMGEATGLIGCSSSSPTADGQGSPPDAAISPSGDAGLIASGDAGSGDADGGDARTSDAPVDAPAEAAPDAGPVELPDCDVKTFGARGDGTTKDTTALQSAINQCKVVRLHDGVFLSGMLRLRSGIELRIEPTATIKGTRDDSDYPDVSPPSSNTQLSDCKKALIYGESVDNVVIDGGGKIDGSGDNPNWTGTEATRPMGIFAAVSTNITIRDITVTNTGMWSVVTLESEHVRISGITVNSVAHPNRDGIDVVDDHDVVIENSTITSDDDAICLKSGSSKGVYDVTVRNSHVLSSNANGLKLGTASVGSFKKILFDTVDVANVNGAVMAVESVDGAAIDDVQFKNIQFQNVGSVIFVLLGRRLLSLNVGSIQNVTFQSVNGTTKWPVGSSIGGTNEAIFGTHYVNSITLSDVHIHNAVGLNTVPSEPPEYAGQYPDPDLWGNLPAYGFFLRHVQGLTTSNVTIESGPGEVRNPYFEDDVVQ